MAMISVGNKNIFAYDLLWKDLVLNDDDIYLSMGTGYVPDNEMLQNIESLKIEVSKIIKPKCLFTIYPAKAAPQNYISIEDTVFHTGVVITPYLKDADYFAVMVATAGREFEEFQHKVKESGDIFKEFLLDSLGSAIAEAVAAQACMRIEKVAASQGWGISYPYSPGYCGWNVSQQQVLFTLLPFQPCGVILSDSSLMAPIKSVSAILAIGKNCIKQKYGCELCRKADCYKKRKIK